MGYSAAQGEGLESHKDPKVGPLKLLMPRNGWEQEVFVPADFVVSVILPAVEHEIGHIVAAAHFGAMIFGIGLGPISERSTDGWFFQAIYGWEAVPVETKCIVFAAGPAADVLYRGRVDDRGASGSGCSLATSGWVVKLTLPGDDVGGFCSPSVLGIFCP